jgi:alanine dehydrogenase
MRVGAAAGIGARLLSRADSRQVGVIGSGGMARTVLEALAQVRAIDAVRVFSRDPANRGRFAQDMSGHLGIAVTPVESAREAARGADILVSATDSLLPVVQADWLEPGMHVVAIGPHDLDSGCAQRIEVVVRQGEDSLDMPRAGQFQGNLGHSRNAFVGGSAEQQARLPATAKPSSGRGQILLTDILAGRAKGRTSDRQITQYRPVGHWGLQFAACGALIYRQAKARGLGRELPTEWFVQDVRN